MHIDEVSPPTVEYTLLGFVDSTVRNLTISVNKYSALTELILNYYSGRLVDVLMVKAGV
jgi:hypothetical protein